MSVNEDWAESALEQARDNHMWVNAFSTIRPTNELKMQIGGWVLELLSHSKKPGEHGMGDYNPPDEVIFRVNSN